MRVKQEPLKIAFVSEEDSRETQSWSGIPRALSEALSKSGAWLCTITPRRAPEPIWIQVIRKSDTFLATRYNRRSLVSLGRSTRNLINAAGPFDFALSIHPDPMAYSGVQLPWAFIGDCNFELLAQTYSLSARQSPGVLAEGKRMWRQGLESASFCAMASNWVAMDTRSRYPSLAHKVREVPFGANVTSGWSETEAAVRVAERSLRPLRLLSVGVDWERKRMDDVLEVFRILSSRGIEACLDLVGCLPPAGRVIPQGVTIHGRLNRFDALENAKLRNLFAEAHCFLLASRAECFGVVFAEAASYALPSIGVASCGVPSAVRDGMTGRTFPNECWNEATADEVSRWVNDPTGYRNLAKTAWQDSETRLNWDVTARILINEIRRSLHSK